MEKIFLGKTSLKVSKICFGTLTLGALQKNAGAKQVQDTVHSALDCGINFFDTAQIYGSYNVIRAAIKAQRDVVVSSKSYAYDEAGAKKAVDECLKEIGRDYVDIFLLHETESRYTIEGHMQAIGYYKKMQAQGKIRYLGFSTHHVGAVQSAHLFDFVDIVHAMLNFSGHGILGGTLQDMEQALSMQYDNGCGIFAMKMFGGGHLLKHRQQAADYILSKPFVHSVAIGMQSPAEVHQNVALMRGLTHENAPIDTKIPQVMDWCVACGACARACPQKAIKLVQGKIVVDKQKCVLCGYCGHACKEAAIKIF